MARFLVTGDWHIRATNPKYRTDNYYETMLGKLDFIFNLAEKENCVAILQPGDFFDSSDIPNHVERDIIKIINLYGISIITVYGQHDTKYRRRENTTMAVWEEARILRIAVDDDTEIVEHHPNIHIYGSSWEEEIPEVADKNAINILLIHKMIVKDKLLWPGQTDYITAKSVLLKYDNYDLIISGDNHQHFTHGKKFGSMLINCGSLMRTTITQRDHQPVVYVVDIDTEEVTKYYIPIKPIEEIMNLELADEVKERNEALEAFMTGLSSDYGIELNFEENLKNLMNKNKTVEEVKELAYSILRRYHEGGK